MKTLGIVVKALFMIVLIILIPFTISDLPLVKAQEEDQSGCCGKTVNGESCVYTTESQCASDEFSPTTCDQTTYCKTGCCVSDIGQCSKSVSRGTCEALDGYTWLEGAGCEVDQCQKKCCVIAESQCAYTTETNCEYLIKDLEDIVLDFRDVGSEQECTNICKSSDRGCCVGSDSSCGYTTAGDCGRSDIDMTTGEGFYKDTYCSDIGICACTEHDSKACIDEDVYWFDSCGNQEDVADDCDITQGTWCGTDKNTGDVGCQSVDCTSTFSGTYYIDSENPGDIGPEEQRNTHDSKIGDGRQSGESWCLYESPAGGWMDRPGSEHYRAYCYFGQEYLEQCTSGREQVCLQYPYTSSYNSTIFTDQDQWTSQIVGDAYSSDVPIAGAKCIDNGAFETSMLNANITTVPIGSLSEEICSKGNLECPVVFAKSFGADTNWECVANCYCLSPGWANYAADYCKSVGDCGADTNIAGAYTEEGFYLSASQLHVGNAYIGYDTDCSFGSDAFNPEKNLWNNPAQQLEAGCTKACEDGSTSGGTEGWCDFISKPTNRHSDYQEFLSAANYGVYGGLVGISHAIGTLSTSISVSGLYDYADDFLYIGLFGLVALYAVGIAIATFSGVVTIGGAAAVTSGLLGTGFFSHFLIIFPASSVVPIIGWIVAAALVIILIIGLLLSTGAEQTTVTVTSHCEPWQPPDGGDACSLCDLPVSQGGFAIDDGQGNILPGVECSQYKCESLGKQCTYITENQETSRPKCITTETNNVNPPYVKDAFLLGKYSEYPVTFTPGQSLVVDQAVEPYTAFEFGITLDGAGQCKISEGDLPENYDLMTTPFPDSYYDVEHNQSWPLMPEQEYTFYIRCKDYKGNSNINPFVVKVETTAGEDDFTTPSILATSVNNGGYISADAPQAGVTFYLSEPATCKWSTADKEYTLMENGMACSGTPSVATPWYEAVCTGVLNVNTGANYYYIRCQDSAGNANTESYLYTLYGTVPLNIDYALPTGTIYYNYTDLYVQTSSGAENGKATCSYDGIEFYETDNTVHRQSLQGLKTGAYTYDISCVDAAGNTNSTQISFTISVDTDAPEIIDIYKQGSTVSFTLDEPASCEYYFEDFEYGEGTEVSSSSTIGSFAVTDLSQYYLKCQDTFGNVGEYTIKV